MKTRQTLKSLFSRGEFGEPFIEAAKRELPELWGRESLLEEFYDHITDGGGHRERVSSIRAQLGTPRRFHGGAFRKLWSALTG